MEALIQAAEAFDVAALKEILGPGSEDLVSSQDGVQDKTRASEFAAKTKEKYSVDVDPKNASKATMSVGNDDWPLPIPIVKRGGKWFFDTKAGRDEILLRRIGANELDALEICRGFVEAQHEYAAEKRDDAKVTSTRKRLSARREKRMAWPGKTRTAPRGGPVGEEIAKALEQGYSDKAKPFHGYYFKVMKGQGPAAPMGEMDFVVGGAMIGGFALTAAPAEYKVTGVQTFMVSHAGIVYEKDLGPDTLKEFQKMERFNPDKTWRRTTISGKPRHPRAYVGLKSHSVLLPDGREISTTQQTHLKNEKTNPPFISPYAGGPAGCARERRRALCCSGTSSSPGRLRHGWYRAIQAGGNIFQDRGDGRVFTNGNGDVLTLEPTNDAGFFGGVKLGYVFGTGGVRFALEEDMFYNGWQSGTDSTLIFNGTVTRASSSLDVNSGAFMTNGLIRFSSGQFQPYIGLGLGFYYAEVINATFGPFTFGGENSHVDFAWQAIAGADFYLDQRNSLFIEYKFLNYTASQANIGEDRNLGQHLLGGGWRFHF